MKDLLQFIKEKSLYVSLKSGESYSGVYKGYKFIEKDIQGETKEVARYLLEDLHDQVVRNFDSQSVGLAKLMNEVPVGAIVKISKTGEGFDTKYKVEFGEEKTKVEKVENDIPIVEDEIDPKEIPF